MSRYPYLLLLLAPFAVSAQTGWQRLGQSLGGTGQSRHDAYTQGVIQPLEMEQALSDARAARDAEQISAIERTWRTRLVDLWLKAGLSPSEARNVALAYRLTNAQIPILQRASKDGIEPTANAAWKAYGEYNYLLANQLLVAGMILQDRANQPQTN
jgi:hypothetical protein